MKKLFAILAVFAVVFSLAACGGKGDIKETAPTTSLTFDDGILIAATEYYDALVDGDTARLKKSMSSIIEKRIEKADPFAGLSDEEISKNEAEYSIDFSDSDAFYAYFAAVMTYKGNVTGITASKVIKCENLSADELEKAKKRIEQEGITGFSITDYTTAEIEVLITYADGSTETDSQFLSFVKENGVWKVFPET